MLKKLWLPTLVGVMVCCLSLSVWAEESEEPVGENPEIVVTATRTPTETSEAPGTVDVVTDEEIQEENPGTEDLAELLSLWLGVQVNTTGNQGGITSLGLRGAGSEQMLVMLNGISLVNPQNGSAPLSYISLDLVDRVEIVQGPLSSVYGEDAMGGTINIIPGGEPGGKFRLGSGSFDSHDLHFSYLWEKGGFMLGRSMSDGYRDNSEYEGDWQYAFARPTWGNWEMELGYYHYSDDKGLPGATYYLTPTAIGRDAQSVAYFTAKSVGETAETILKLYRTSISSYYQDEWTAGENDAFRWGGEAQSTWTIGPQFTLVTVGKWEKTGVESYMFDEKSGFSRNLSAQLTWSPLDELQVYIGDLWTHHSLYGSNHSPRLAVVYQAGSEWILKAIASRAFRAPTYNELYWEDPYMIGNPDLRPETSLSYELGAEYHPADNFEARFSLYRSRVKDLIEWVTSDYIVWQATNYQRAQLTGFDGSLSWKLDDRWKAGFQSHLLRAMDYNESSGDYSEKITSRVPSSGVFSLSYEGETVQAAWFTRYFQGHGNVDAAAVSDLAFSFGLSDDLRLRFGVQNVFDREYCFNAGYPMPGINYRFELSYTF